MLLVGGRCPTVGVRWRHTAHLLLSRNRQQKARPLPPTAACTRGPPGPHVHPGHTRASAAVSHPPDPAQDNTQERKKEREKVLSCYLQNTNRKAAQGPRDWMLSLRTASRVETGGHSKRHGAASAPCVSLGKLPGPGRLLSRPPAEGSMAFRHSPLSRTLREHQRCLGELDRALGLW